MADLTYGGDERELVTQRIRIQQKLAALGMTWEDIAPPTSLAPGAPAGVPRTLVAEPTLTPEQQITRASAQAFGGGPGDYDPSQGISATDRAQLGAFSDDNAEERMAALQRMYPGAQIAPVAEDVFGIKAPGAPVRYTNPPGVELGSLAQFGTQYGPEMVGGIGGTAAGALATPVLGPAGPVVGGATGAGLARGSRELVQKAFGTQRESAGDVAGQMAIAGGAELLGPVAKVAWNAVKSAGRAVAGKASASVVQDFMSKLSPDELTHAINVLNEKEGLNLPPLMVFQKYPDPIVEKVVKQVSQYSQEAQDRIAAQMDGLAKSSRGAIPTPAGTATSDELVQGMMAKDYKNTLQLRAPRSNPLGAGRAMGEGVQESIKAEKAAMGEQYNRLYGYLDENPHRFDLGPAQVSARARNIPGELSEDEIAQQIAAARLPDGSIDLGAIDEFINVAQPNEKLSRINSVLQRLEPEQDFHVIKELRTQAGSLMEMPLAQKLKGGVNDAQVKAVYGDLSRAMMKPVGGDDTFTALAKETNAQAKRYYDNFSDTQIGKVLESADGNTQGILFNQFASAPDNLTPELLAKMSKTKAQGEFRQGLDSAIMRTEDPVATINQWKKSAPEAYDWMYPTPRAKDLHMRSAQEMSALNSGPAREAADAAYTQVGFARKTLDDYASNVRNKGMAGRPEDRFKGLVAKAGDVNSPERTALRSAAMEDILGKAIKPHAKGGEAINPKDLLSAIEAAKKNGEYMGVLTTRDRKVIETVLDYAKKTWKSGDMGAGLAVAAGIGKLRRGGIEGLKELGHTYSARRMATFLTNESIDTGALFAPMRRAQGVSASLAPAFRVAASAVKQGWLAPAVSQEQGLTHPQRAPVLGPPPIMPMRAPPSR